MKLKRVSCVILFAAMAFGILTGCKAKYKDTELDRAVELGIGKYSETDNVITYAEFFSMLDAVISLANADDLEKWQNDFAEAHQSQQTMTRREGMVAVYMAAEAMGEDYYFYNDAAGWKIFNEIEAVDDWIFWDEMWAGDYEMFPDMGAISLIGDSYINSAYFYSMLRISLFSEQTIFDYDSEAKSMRPAEPFTYTEGLRAAVRLYDSVPRSSNSEVEIISPSDLAAEEEKYADAPAPVIASRTMPEDYSLEPVPFKTEIDDFYARVKEMPIPGEYEEICSNYKQYSFSVRKLEVDGIPLYESKQNNGKLKPLVIQLHGGGGQKDLNYGLNWLEENVCMVSIDCANHGESKDGPLQPPAIYMETVRDIDVLVEYYNTIPDVDASNFALLGSSMGGGIALSYVVYGKYKPTAIEVEIACPDPSPYQPAMTGGMIWSLERLADFISDFKPANHPEFFTDVWVYACCGQLDTANPPEKMESFKQAIEALGGEKFVFRRYDGIGHDVPQSWFDNEMKDFFSKLRS